MAKDVNEALADVLIEHGKMNNSEAIKNCWTNGRMKNVIYVIW